MMVADAVIYHPTVSHYLKFVATTGKSLSDHYKHLRPAEKAKQQGKKDWILFAGLKALKDKLNI